VVRGPGDAIDYGGDRAGAHIVTNLYGHDGGTIGYASHAQAVVGGLGNGAGHVGAVAVVIVGVAVAVHEVIAGCERRAGQVGSFREASVVLVGHAGVDYRHHHPRPVGDIPGLLHLDLGHVPLVRVVGVIRCKGHLPDYVSLRQLHPWVRFQSSEGFALLAWRHANEGIAWHEEIAQYGRSFGGYGSCSKCPGHARLEFDDQFSRDELGSGEERCLLSHTEGFLCLRLQGRVGGAMRHPRRSVISLRREAGDEQQR